MDPDSKKMLEETYVLVRDNNRMLHTIRRHQWYSLLTTIIFWIVILVTPFYLYQQYLQPLITKFSATSTAGVPITTTSTDLQKLLNSFKVGQ